MISVVNATALPPISATMAAARAGMPIVVTSTT